jgi:ribose transport system permease protein
VTDLPSNNAAAGTRPAGLTTMHRLTGVLKKYGVIFIILALMITLTILSPSFLTPRNLLNIANQSAPLAIIAVALTLVIIAGGFDLSAGAIFGVASCSAAWLAVNVDPILGLIVGPFVGLVLGILNGLIITGFNVHSFLATLATNLVYRGIAVLITGGTLIPVRMESFAWLGRGRIGMVNVAVIVFLIFAIAMMVLLNRTTFGRRVFAVGGNEEAAILSGVRTNLIKIATFGLTGFAAGLAGVIAVSRISMGQPQAGAGFEFDAIAAVILGGTSIYGGAGAIWRSIAGVLLMALIGNGFNILNVNPFFKDLTTGLIIVVAVALSAGKKRR